MFAVQLRVFANESDHKWRSQLTQLKIGFYTIVDWNDTALFSGAMCKTHLHSFMEVMILKTLNVNRWRAPANNIFFKLLWSNWIIQFECSQD